ncbi:MAG TPA: DUF4147 domain-containing protein [Candidatus Lokiarchaeia archaeon]|nr:DUF4147 domain-containing protein [Candidatus Lokiarchaeia archaeon]
MPSIVQNKDKIIANGMTPWHSDARTLLLESFERGLDAVNPYMAIQHQVKLLDDAVVIGNDDNSMSFPLDRIGRVLVVGGGKATAAMAMAMEDILGDKIIAGFINMPEKLLLKDPPCLHVIKVTGSSHPIPNQAGVDGVRRMLDLAEDIQEKDLVFCLLSGGGSALMPQPVDGVSLEEKQELNRVLIECGATIHEVNTVRKHVSKVKGGWLAKHFQPATVIGLLLSDVVGDDMSTIASGPTVPDPTTFADVIDIFERRNIIDRIPESVKQHVLQGLNGEVPETPKPEDESFKNVHNIIIGSARIAAEEIKKEVIASKETTGVHILTDRLEGEASIVGKDFANLIKALQQRKTNIKIDASSGFFKENVLNIQYGTADENGSDALLIFTGETTVTIKGNGVGGRNQEMLLATSIELEAGNDTRFAMIGCGMDGIEGNSTAAGAVIDDLTMERSQNLELQPVRYLENNDSNTYFSNLGDVIITGPTGTNVNDLGMILVDVPVSSITIKRKS